MKPLKLIAQTIILTCLGVSALFLIFSQPEDTSETWLQTLALSKVTGVAVGALFFRLYHIWMGTPRNTTCNTEDIRSIREDADTDGKRAAES